MRSGHGEEGESMNEVSRERVSMTTGENVPGDSEIVAMLIVHFQSPIKFNNLSASTCYSNSVTESSSGMRS